MMLGLDRAHFLSPTGQCKAFDASADGYSRSEGCGIFVLKKLSDAVAENDNILGVIRGIEVNQSGLAHSITHPHAPTQATLFRTLLENTGVEANCISVIEAHGTGTQAGDPNELESIRSVFAIKREVENPLHITSVKANIGHLEAASGSAGLAKLLLMLKNRTIPRVVSLKNLNPLIAPLTSDNTIIDTVQTEWKAFYDKTRMAMLNNFGAAGSNTAMLLEEFRSAERAEPPTDLAYVFGLSAKTEPALNELRNRYIDWLKGPKSSSNLANIAYTMTARRWVYEHRIAIQASTKEELIEKLSKASPVHVQDETGKVVFVFSGQGIQYLGMGKTLYETSELFKKHIDECHSFLVASGFPGVTQILLAGENGSGLAKLEEFEAYQAAIFSLEYALAKLWMSWGLTPAAVVGHRYVVFVAVIQPDSNHRLLALVNMRLWSFRASSPSRVP
jgi:acyl transferase domain-containing protein